MIPTFVITFFTKIVGEKFAKAAAIASGVVLIVALLSIGKCTYDRHVENAYVDKVQKKATVATDKAADERAKDTVSAAQSEKELHEAVNAAQGGTISPAAHALACERLKRVGKVPPSCQK